MVHGVSLMCHAVLTSGDRQELYSHINSEGLVSNPGDQLQNNAYDLYNKYI